MSQKPAHDEKVAVHVENIGGIEETSVELASGVSVLTGRNATNRTSLLQAIMAALGSDQVSMKSDADEALVQLEVGDSVYERRFSKNNGSVVTDGDPYFDDPMEADLFAFLLEQNEARQAVAQGKELREIVMRPVDTEQLESRISHLQSRKEGIDSKLDEITSLKRELPEIERRKSEIETEITEKKEQLAKKQEKIESFSADPESQHELQERLESKLNELNAARSEVDSVRRKIESHEESIDALESERAELTGKVDEDTEVPEEKIEQIRSDLQRLRNQRARKETKLDELQTVVEFNEGFIDGESDLSSLLGDSSHTDGSVTDRIVDDEEEVVCWTCGSEVNSGQIESMLDELRGLRSRLTDELTELREQITEFETEVKQLENRQQEYAERRNRLDQIDREIEDHETRLETLREQRDTLSGEVEELESEVEDLRSEDQSELLDLQTEVNRIELEIERLEDNKEELIEELERIEGRIAEEDQLNAQRSEIQSEIEELRTREERLEAEVLEEFNSHMDSLLEILEFDNIERIWIERTEEVVRDGRRKTTERRFNLHIVRTTEPGTVYEDTVENLSESEREVTGLVFALAGYLAHDLYDEVPIMLLDSMEALDSGRIEQLVEYFEQFTDNLVIALLEEDAEGLDDEYRRVTEI